jgi:hypothetical protein
MMAKILDIVKKNLISIICGVIALVAVGALYYPVSGYYDELRTEADQRVAVYNSLNTLRTKPRTLPVTSLTDTTAPPLEGYPTQAVINAWRGVTDKIKLESDQMYQTAIDLNKAGHEVLEPDALPSGGVAALGEFRRKYQTEMITITPEARKVSMVGRILGAGAPPTVAEIEEARRAAEAELRRGAAGFNAEILKQQLDDRKSKIPRELREKAAKENKMYAQFDPAPAVPMLPELSSSTTAITAEAVFRAQMTMWVQRDVLKALAAVNKDATEVANAPVKHLFSLRVSDASINAFGSSLSMAQSFAGGAPPTTEPSQDLPKNPNASLTGRRSNGVYDVLRFNLRIFVEAEQVPRVLQELSRNQFITVINVNQQSVDLGRWQAFGYFYGDKPLVQLDLSGEELFMRAWTIPLMPKGVKLALGLIQPDQPPQ